jgi:hypothetical protein
VDGDADFSVPTDAVLHSELVGLTLTAAPGARTIRTADLDRFLTEARPIVIGRRARSSNTSYPTRAYVAASWRLMHRSDSLDGNAASARPSRAQQFPRLLQSAPQ